MRKYHIPFKIKNYLTGILSNQIYHPNSGMAEKLSIGEYWIKLKSGKHKERK